MSQTTKQFRRQLPKNVTMAILSFVTYSVSAIWLTPYLVNHLGVAAYGLVPLAGLFTQYVSIITSQISGAVNRFLTIEINKPDGEPNVIFNSAFALYLILIIIQGPLFAAGLVYADRLFSMPAELKADALLLIGCSAGSFLVSLLGAVFGVSAFSKNRIDIGATINLGRLICRLVLIVLCFSTLGPKLRYIGYVDLGLNITMLAVSVRVCRKLTPELFISLRLIDWSILSPIFKMSFWSLLNNMGALLYLRTDIWIVNRFISPVAAGKYAVIIVISNFIRQLVLMFNGQIGPVSMMYWAKGELHEISRFLLLAVKVLSIGLAIPCTLICINGGRMLELWMGPDFSDQSMLLLVLCIHLPINLAVFPLLQLQTASNSVKIPALVTFFLGMLNVVASYVLAIPCGFGMLGVAMATAIVLTMKNVVFTPIYSARILKQSSSIFLRPLYNGLLMLSFVWIISLIPMDKLFCWVSGDLQRFFLRNCVFALLAGVVGWSFLLSRNERRTLIGMLPEKWKGFAMKFGTSTYHS